MSHSPHSFLHTSTRRERLLNLAAHRPPAAAGGTGSESESPAEALAETHHQASSLEETPAKPSGELDS